MEEACKSLPTAQGNQHRVELNSRYRVTWSGMVNNYHNEVYMKVLSVSW